MHSKYLLKVELSNTDQKKMTKYYSETQTRTNKNKKNMRM